MTTKNRLDGLDWLMRSSALILAGSAVGQVFGLAATAILTHSLDLEAFGRFSLILALISFTTTIANNALARTLARFCSYYWSQGANGALVGTLLGVTGGAVLIAAGLSLALHINADWIAEYFLHDRSLVNELRIILPVIPATVGASCLFQSLRGIGFVTDKVLLESILRPLSKLLAYCALFFLFGGITLRSVIWIETATVLSIFLIALFATLWRFRPYLSHKPQFHWKELGQFTLPLVPAMMSFQLARQLPMLALGLSGRIAEAGLLFAGMKIAAIGEMALMSLNSNFAPMISAYQGSERMEELRNIYRQVTCVIVFVLSIWVGGVIVFGEYALMILGQSFLEAYMVLVLLTLQMVIIGLTGPVSHMLTMTGHTWETMLSSFVFLGVTGLLAAVLIPIAGAKGAAMTSLLAVIIYQYLQGWWVNRKLNISGFNPRNYFGCALLITSAFMVKWIANVILIGNSIWIGVALSGFMYGLAVFLVVITIITTKERNVLVDSFRRMCSLLPSGSRP